MLKTIALAMVGSGFAADFHLSAYSRIGGINLRY